MSDALSAWVVGQSGTLRAAFPDTETMVVTRDNGNNTYDVRRPGWGSSRQLTQISNVNPDLVGQISVDDTVLVGAYNGNPQQWAILSKAGYMLTAEVVGEIIAVVSADWPVVGRDESRSRNTGDEAQGWQIPPAFLRVDDGTAACAVILDERIHYLRVGDGSWRHAVALVDSSGPSVSHATWDTGVSATSRRPVQMTAFEGDGVFDFVTTWVDEA